MMKKLSLIIVLFLLTACEQAKFEEADVKDIEEKKSYNITGLWRGELTSPGGELPFGIDIIQKDGKYIAKLLNGEERVDTSSVEFDGTHLTINFAWFDARLKAEFTNKDTLFGHWSKTASGKDQTSSLPFKATRGYQHRFSQEINHATITPVTGKWEVTFSDEDGDDIAVAEFNQEGQVVSGTFLTPTGDYRYLSGVANDGKLYLSTFDGAHAFLFNAEVDKGNISKGNFWSRDSYHATWTALKSENTAEFLPNSWEMNKTTSKVEFAFEDGNGKLVQLTDKRFENKPVLINLFGTWCPNCNDEAPVLSKFYDKYNAQGLEIIGLAFEFTEDPIRDKKQLAIFKQRHKINYPLLLAGGNDKTKATKVLGFIDKVKSYPTTIFLDKNHEVVKIHTGFSGSGTGEHFTKLVQELDEEIIKLLN